jgi:hypothetical protein
MVDHANIGITNNPYLLCGNDSVSRTGLSGLEARHHPV